MWVITSDNELNPVKTGETQKALLMQGFFNFNQEYQKFFAHRWLVPRLSGSFACHFSQIWRNCEGSLYDGWQVMLKPYKHYMRYLFWP